MRFWNLVVSWIAIPASSTVYARNSGLDAASGHGEAGTRAHDNGGRQGSPMPVPPQSRPGTAFRATI